MDLSLKKRLRSADRNIRFRAIEELPLAATSESIKILMKIAKGSRRRWFKKYDFADQIHAMEALLKVGNNECISFLKIFF